MELINNEEDEKMHMTTMVSCLARLQVDGFIVQFKAVPHGLLSLSSQKTFTPDQVKIAHYFRFEGESDPSDSAILYAIEAWDGEKGTLVDGYGKESDGNTAAFINQVAEMNK